MDRQTDIDTDKQRLGSTKYNEGNCHKNIYKKTTRQKEIIRELIVLAR